MHAINKVTNPAEIISKWNLKFNNDNVLTADEFLIGLEERRLTYQISQEDILRCMPQLLEGRPLGWFRLNRIKFSNWATFEATFRSMFLPLDYLEQIEEAIRSRTQGEKETITDFVIVLCTLMSRLSPPPSKEQQLSRIFRNLLLNTNYSLGN